MKNLAVAVLMLLVPVLSFAQDSVSAVSLSKDSVEACYRCGVELFSEGCYEEAVVMLKRAAVGGLADAQYDYGLCCFNGSGTAEDKAELAFELIEKAAEYGVSEDRIFLDLLIFDASTRGDTATEFNKAIRMIKEKYPNVLITGALSNVSFTLPVKKALNSAFLVLAMEAGLDSFIGDTTNRDLKAVMLAADVLLEKDRHCRKYTTAFRKGEIGPVKK